MKNICIALVLMFAANAALADQFQFTIGSGTNASYASYANVRVLNSANKEIFKGFADRYGRISIVVPPGQPQQVVVIVVMQGKEMMTPLRLTGASGLRPINLH
jgi:hypothetical protein